MADVSELKAAEIRGELLPREKIEMQMAAESIAVRALLLSWSMTLSDAVYQAATSDGPHGVERVIDGAVHEILSEVCRRRSSD